MSGATIAIDAPAAKPKSVAIKRVPAKGKCPSCDTVVEVSGSSHKCGNCNLTAPRSAFVGSAGSSNLVDGKPASNRAWTIGGMVD